MPTPFDDIYSIEDKIKYINFLESDLDEDNYWQYKSLLEECANAGSEESVIKLSEIYRYGDNFTDQDKNAAIEILKVFFQNISLQILQKILRRLVGINLMMS